MPLQNVKKKHNFHIYHLQSIKSPPETAKQKSTHNGCFLLYYQNVRAVDCHEGGLIYFTLTGLSRLSFHALRLWNHAADVW